MQQSSKTLVSREKHEEKDYLYINMRLILIFIGIIVGIIVYTFPQLFDTDTLMALLLILLVFIYGSTICVRLALKNHAHQTRILSMFCFFLSLVSVAIGVIAIYDNKKLVAILSLVLTIPISFFSILPTFYYGDRRENEPQNPIAN